MMNGSFAKEASLLLRRRSKSTNFAAVVQMQISMSSEQPPKQKSIISHYAAAIEKAVSGVESSAAVVVEEGAQAVRRASVTFYITAEMGVESVLHAASTGVHEAESAVVDAVTVVDAAARSSLSQKLTRSSRVTESEKTGSNGAVMRCPNCLCAAAMTLNSLVAPMMIKSGCRHD